MQNVVDAAEADGVPIIQTWANMQEAMIQVLAGKLKSKTWSPQRRRMQPRLRRQLKRFRPFGILQK